MGEKSAAFDLQVEIEGFRDAYGVDPARVVMNGRDMLTLTQPFDRFAGQQDEIGYGHEHILSFYGLPLRLDPFCESPYLESAHGDLRWAFEVN